MFGYLQLHGIKLQQSHLLARKHAAVSYQTEGDQLLLLGSDDLDVAPSFVGQESTPFS